LQQAAITQNSIFIFQKRDEEEEEEILKEAETAIKKRFARARESLWRNSFD
jgi:hypothetical protein